jgi:hypothetical protein
LEVAVRSLVVAVVAALVLGVATPAPAQVSDQERLRHAVDYLLASQLPSGLFRYDFDFLADRPVEGDHIVRQVGAAYFLGEHYLHARDRRVRLAIEAALKTFGELSLTIGKSPLQSVLEQARLLSLPIGRYKLRAALDRTGLLYRSAGDGKVVSPDGKYRSAHAGATALGLLAELQYYQATGANRFGDLRSAWLKGLMSLWIPGRGFRITPDSIDESPFYDGEAWLALAYYHELFPHDQTVSSLLKSLDTYLMTRYASEVSTGFYQWGTMAAARRLTVTSNPAYLNFIRTQALTLLGAPRRDQWRGDNSCAEIEGLATAARVLGAHTDPDRALLERIRARVNEEMEKNRRLQIPPKAARMMFADGVYLSSPNLRDFSGAFLEGSLRPYTRIDHTLHCVSALTKLTQ